MSDKEYTYRIFVERFPSKYFTEVIQGIIENFPNDKINKQICYDINELNNSPNTIFIIFAGHRLQIVPDNSIIVNFEQLYDGSPHVKPSYMDILKSHTIWEYSAQNKEWLNSKGITNIKDLNIGYSTNMDIRGKLKCSQDIDVLFCGAKNPRREELINKIKADPRIKNVMFVSNAWGTQKDELIKRAKIVLNIHFFPTNIFEIVRVFQLLANKKCVISEKSNFPDNNSKWNEGIVFFNDSDDMINKIVYYLENNNERKEMEENGYKLLMNRKWKIPIV